MEQKITLQKAGFFDPKPIKSQVELWLKHAGTKIIDKDTPYGIFIKNIPVLVGERLVRYSISIRPPRPMFFVFNGRRYTCLNASNHGYSIYVAMGNKISAAVEGLMVQFLRDYLKAYPKKKE